MSDFRALIVDDEKTYATALSRALKRRDVECDIALDAESALTMARSAGPFAVVLLDNRLPDTLGLRIIPRLRAIMPGAGIVMMTAYESIEDAVEAMRLGAEDYVAKSTHTEPIVARVLEVRERILARSAYDPHIPTSREDALLGTSDVMRSVRDRLVEVASSSETPVLIVGETGTGKGLAARFVHSKGPHAGSPFVTLSCSSGTVGPADAAIFGRIRHTVSGAEIIESGILETAGIGVLLLDAIDEAPERLQKMLLGVIESGTFRRMGASDEVAFRARVVATASRLSGPGDVHEGLVRRLDVFPITLPPLRERGDDVMVLTAFFIEHFAGRMGKSAGPVPDDVASLLRAYDYPGNVRELKNIVERAMIMMKGDRLYPEHLPERVLRHKSDPASTPPAEPTPAHGSPPVGGQGLGIEFVPGVDTIDSVEKRLIVRALEMSAGVKSRAAKLLGISRFQLLRRLEKYGLEPGER